MTVPISIAVEGLTDEVLVRRIIHECGLTIGTVYGRNGKPHLRTRIGGYNNAARQQPWFVLVDLDNDPCAVALYNTWLPTPSRLMCLRVAVRELESWLLADRIRLADFLKVSLFRIPLEPETVPDPKLALVNIARRSSSPKIREGIAPRGGSGRVVGELYSSLISEFIED